MKPGYGKLILLLLCIFSSLSVQAKKHEKVSMKDSLDGAFDMSDYLITAHGFIPVPMIITEPALGGFGGGFAAVFLQKRKPMIDTVNGEVKVIPVPPDITGGAGAYTANNSWLAGGFRSGFWAKPRIKYMVGGAYVDMNMSYYRTLDKIGEKEFAFNITSPSAFLQATKRVGHSRWFVGLKYLFLQTKVTYKGNVPAEWVKPIEYSSTVSQLGVVGELDSRDNTFTPNKGMKIHVDAICSDNIIGSDYDYWRSNYYMYAYKRLSKKLVGGLRLDGQQTFEDAPFFLYPYIDMRGIPANRYSGKADILGEAEFRWNVYRRWSVMFYGGGGKAFNEWSEFSDAEWAYAVGTGFRYLIARKFGLHMGVDLARGPEQFAYYIVFGSNWLK